MSKRHRQRPAVAGVLAALLAGSASGAFAQEQTDPPPPQPDTTTVEEPVAAPDAPPAEPPTEQPAPEEAKHVPPDASEIPLSTLETRNFSLLYFDPVQTYLTPYIGRAFENALDFHKRKFNWTPWDRTTVLL